MHPYNWIIENKELMKIFYAFIVTFICVFIVLKTDKLFRLSLHKGIRYFRNAFFFYGIAFAVRYFLGAYENAFQYNFLIKILFEYFLVMAGFFLFYSLYWKKIEHADSNYLSSLLNANIFIFHVMAVIIAILDYLWNFYYLMFSSQILLFILASAISYKNYKTNGKNHRFLKFYFTAMMLSFFAWTLNAVAAVLLNWNYGVLVSTYILNIIIFLLFLYGVIKVTAK